MDRKRPTDADAVLLKHSLVAGRLKGYGCPRNVRGRLDLPSFGVLIGMAVLMMLAACGGRDTEVLLPA